MVEIVDLESGRAYDVSYSALRQFLSCPEKWRQGRVLKRPRQPGWASVGGRAVHTLTEIWEAEYSQTNESAAA